MAKDERKLQALAANVIEQIITAAIHGIGPMKGAVEVAGEHLATHPDREEAIAKLVTTHVRLAAASGFLTGLGGVVTLPVSIPVSVGGLLVLGARMSAGIAHLRGYDVDSEEVRSAVLLTLLGTGGAEVLKKTGVEVGKKTTAAMIKKVPGRLLIEINKKIGYRLVTKAGEKGVVNLTKLVPLVGAPVGAVFDGIGCKTIATFALRMFEPLDAVDEPDVIVVEGEYVVVDEPSGPEPA